MASGRKLNDPPGVFPPWHPRNMRRPQPPPVIYETDGVVSKNLVPPILGCNQCGAVTVPQSGQTSIRCRCGKIYNLITVDGKPVNQWPAEGG